MARPRASRSRLCVGARVGSRVDREDPVASRRGSLVPAGRAFIASRHDRWTWAAGNPRVAPDGGLSRWGWWREPSVCYSLDSSACGESVVSAKPGEVTEMARTCSIPQRERYTRMALGAGFVLGGFLLARCLHLGDHGHRRLGHDRAGGARLLTVAPDARCERHAQNAPTEIAANGVFACTSGPRATLPSCDPRLPT